MGFAKRSLTLGLVCVAVLAAGIFALPSAALAADGDKPTYELGLYAWGSSVAGQVDTPEGDASTHISFSDLLSNLNVAAMARARANFGKFSVVFDGEYFDLESDTENRNVRLGPQGNVTVPVSAKVELLQYILELNTGYEVFDVSGPFSAGPNDDRGTRGELYLGARYISLKPTIKVEVGPVSAKLGEWDSWVDGLVGARLFVDLSKTVVLGVQGDVGGFNIGQSDNLAWSQITSLSWAFSDSMSLSLGYKFLDFRRESGDSTINIQLRGPFVATSVRF
jgi:opacity protein-like surface antigen